MRTGYKIEEFRAYLKTYYNFEESYPVRGDEVKTINVFSEQWVRKW
jgi:hypothetical protein